MSASTPEEGVANSASGTTSSFYTTSTGSLCSGNPQAVCRHTDARSITTTYAYDAENRVTSKTYSDSTPAVTYFYDQTSYNGLTITNGKGRRTGMSDGSGATAWSYDSVGKVLSERRTIAGVTKTIAYAYNLNGSVSQIQYPGGRLVSYVLDTAGRLAAATDNDGVTEYAYSASYAPQGGLASVYLNGNLVTYVYNNRLKPTTLQVNSGSTLNLAYNYFGNGNVNVITNNRTGAGGRSQTLTYDYLNRVATAQSQATSGTDCWGQSFGYDRYGNLTSASSTKCSSPALSLSVNSKNQITNTGFTYDSAGNLTGDGLLSYTWDAENHLKSAAGVTYTYDGDGRRVKKSNGKLYWYSTSGQVLEETDLSGNLLNDYIFFGGQRIARRDASGGYYAFFADALGSARAIIHGTLCYDADFYPFGGERIDTNTCAQNYKFTGLERDAESGLDNTLNRKYSSNLGRWLSPDPKAGDITNPQSLDRYAYVLGNPTNLVDPLGLDDFNPADPCSDFFFAITNAECPSPDQTTDLVDFFFLLEIFRDLPGSGGGGGGGGGGAGSGNTFLGQPCLDPATQAALEDQILLLLNKLLGTSLTRADVKFGVNPRSGSVTVTFTVKGPPLRCRRAVWVRSIPP